jgi:hypothetical protein
MMVLSGRKYCTKLRNLTALYIYRIDRTYLALNFSSVLNNSFYAMSMISTMVGVGKGTVRKLLKYNSGWKQDQNCHQI